MAKEVVIDINVKTAKADKNVQNLNKDLQQTKTDMQQTKPQEEWFQVLEVR